MSKSSFSNIAARSLVILLSLSFTSLANAEGKGKSAHSQAMNMDSPEMKKDMADMYQKMADCMRTDKTMQDCHKEVMKDCPVAKATGHCPIMEGMKPMEGMKHGSMKGMNMDHSEMKK